MQARWLGSLLALPLVATVSFAVACSGDDGDSSAGAEGGAGGGGGSGGGSAALVGAPGVTVSRIDLLQGPQRKVMENGALANDDVPIVAGRRAVVRVYYRTDAAYDGGPVVGRLSVGSKVIREVPVAALPAEAVESDFGSTFNFEVQGEDIGEELAITAEILQEKPEANGAARWSGVVPVEGKPNKLRLVVVPFRYDADGSGRIPDVGPEAAERMRQRFFSIYPVSDVELTVHEPEPWNQTLGRDGSGWQAVGFRLSSMRSAEVGANSDVYYYGIFNPAETLIQYCGTSGCLLGVTLLNNRPPDVGSPQLRIALGVGFSGYADDTAAHEIGHAHGRPHAPCAPGNQIDGVDPQYPHPNARLGRFGYDLAKGTFVDPNRAYDIMSYCQQQFVSDYQYKAFFARSQRVNQPRVVGQGVTYDVIGIDGHGEVAWGSPLENTAPLLGDALPADVVRDDGSVERVDAQFFAYDHMPGGWLLLPRSSAGRPALRASVRLDGSLLSVER